MNISQLLKKKDITRDGFPIRIAWLLSTALFLTTQMALAQTDSVSTKNLMDMSMEELMNVSVEVASGKAQTQEQAPSIVAVITRQDIKTYGARDITDILRMVPGFEFGVDVVGLFGMSFRGIWAYEGKALVMINGLLINDLAYGSTNMFGTVPAAIIEKVEIIRGPGSVPYGGFAEVTVINITTHKGASLDGIQASANAGLVGGKELSRNVNLSLGTKLNEKNVELATHIGFGNNPQSARTYTPFIGDIPPVRLNEENAYRNAFHVIADAKVKNLTARYNYTSFTFSGQQNAEIFPRVNGIYAEKLNNTVQSAALSYNGRLSKKFMVQPLVEYVRSNALNTTVYPALSVQAPFAGPNTQMARYRGECVFIYNVQPASSLLFGGGYLRDHVASLSHRGEYGLQLSSNPADTAKNTFTVSRYGFMQYETQLRNFGLTLGGRYEHTSFGNAFAPRASVTYARGKLNFKLLYGRSFRIPLPFQAFSRNLSVSEEGLRPETANSLDLEAGYRYNAHVTTKINVFYIDIQKPIVYLDANESYNNFGVIKSTGVEAELQVRYPKYGGYANLSYAVPAGATTAGFLSASQTDFMGMSPVKINAGAYWKIGNLQVAPSLTFLSSKVGVSQAYATGETGETLDNATYPALALVNASLTYQVANGIELNLAGYNLFAANYRLLQPYYDAHAPMPVNDRQFALGVIWRY